jgi:hypothetical protein
MNSDEFNPYRAPEAVLTTPAEFPDATVLRPVPFEDIEAEPRFWPRVWAMFSLLFKNPMELAERVPVTQGFSAPWQFQMVLAIPLLVLVVLIAVVFGLITVVASMESGKHASGGPPPWFMGLFPLVYLIILPIMQFLNMFIIGALSHGSLWIWGGHKQSAGLHATCRLTGYFLAFFMLVGLIPIIGSLAALVGPIFLGMGMARIHRTDTWRGICAAYTPLMVFCCGIAVMFFAIFALTAANWH